MADEENKKTGQQSQQNQPTKKANNAQNVGGSSNTQKKRRRRPRKRKPSTNNANTQNNKSALETMIGEDDSGNKKTQSSQPKRRTRHRPKKRRSQKEREDTQPKKEEQKKEEEFTLDEIEETNPIEEAVPEIDKSSEIDEGGFDLSNIDDDTSLDEDVVQEDIAQGTEAQMGESDDTDEDFSLDETSDDETPTLDDTDEDFSLDETSDDETPTPDDTDEDFSLDEEVPEVEEQPVMEEEEVVPESEPESQEPIPPVQPTEGPTDWNQLKEAIKQDHVETEKKMTEGGEVVSPAEEATPTDVPPEAIPAAAAAGAAMGAAIASEEPQEEPTPEPEVIPPPNTKTPEDDLERKEVMQIITRYAIGGCVVIAIIAAIFLFRLPQMAFEGITGLFSGDETKQEEVVDDGQGSTSQTTTDKTKELESTFVAGENQGTSRDKFEEGVETALLSGDGSPAYEGAPDAIKTLYLTGLEVTTPDYYDRISSYMLVLLKLQNAFSTDLHQLLDNASDREEALDVHLRELSEIYQESLDTLSEVNEEKDKLKVQFNDITNQKDRLEEDFFVSLEQLEGNKSNDLLNSFIETSKRQTELKAEYNALNKVAKLFDTAIANMEVRKKDIEYNRRALIKGVQVVDIKGSDLDLIIQEGDLQ